MKFFSFRISQKDNLRFARLSKDLNPIHTRRLYGKKSVFRENICYGVLIILKIFNKIRQDFQYSLNSYSIKIKFIKPAFFNKNILVKYNIDKTGGYFVISQNCLLIITIQITNNLNTFDILIPKENHTIYHLPFNFIINLKMILKNCIVY